MDEELKEILTDIAKRVKVIEGLLILAIIISAVVGVFWLASILP